MIPYSQMCNVCNVCNARLARCYVNFFRKVSIFFRNSCEKENVRSISLQEALSRPSPSTQQLSEAAKAANRTEIVSPTNEQYKNRSKLLRYHYKQAARRAATKQCNNALTYLSKHYKRYKRYTF